MDSKTRAIVLRTIKYGDKRIIVDMFTRSHGRMAFAVTLSQSSKGRMKKQLFQPMTLLSIESDFRPQASLQRLKDIRLTVAYSSIPFDAHKLGISLFLAEFIYHALRGEQRNEQLFDYIESSMEWLDNCQEKFANFHLVFMMRLSKFLGFFPNLSDYAKGCRFDLRSACFTATVPTHSDYVDADEAAALTQLIRMDFFSMHLFRLSRHDRNRLAELITTYYRLHLPSFPELKSLQVLGELYG